MSRLPLEFTFIDNNGKTARTGMHMRRPDSIAELDSALLAYAGALSALSSAAILSARWQLFVDGLPTPSIQPGANIYERGVLIFRDGTDYGVLSIPAPRGVLFDMDGPYRDIRISRQTLAMLGVLGPLEAAVASCALPDGTAFPSLYSVGGTTELKP